MEYVFFWVCITFTALILQLPLLWNVYFWGSFCPRVGENIPHAYIEVYIFETLSRTIAFIFAFASQNN